MIGRVTYETLTLPGGLRLRKGLVPKALTTAGAGAFRSYVTTGVTFKANSGRFSRATNGGVSGALADRTIPRRLV